MTLHSLATLLAYFTNAAMTLHSLATLLAYLTNAAMTLQSGYLTDHMYSLWIIKMEV